MKIKLTLLILNYLIKKKSSILKELHEELTFETEEYRKLVNKAYIINNKLELQKQSIKPPFM